MGVRSLAQMLEILKCVLDQPFVKRAQIGAGMAERVGAGEMPEIPAYEGKIETVVVADKQGAAFHVVGDPARERLHDGLRIIEGQRLRAREAGDCQRLR